MATNQLLSVNFWLSEAPCWTLATPAQVAKLQETVARVVQPVRTRFGPTYITSWLWWSNGCTPRTGVHREGGTVDFQVANGRTLEAWEWGKTALIPSGYIGRWIYEPEIINEDTGEKIQGEHIHVAPRVDMLAYNGDGRIQVLKELPDGGYFLDMEWTEGTYIDPYDLPGITVEVPRQAGFPWWFGAGFVLAALAAAGQEG